MSNSYRVVEYIYSTRSNKICVEQNHPLHNGFTYSDNWRSLFEVNSKEEGIKFIHELTEKPEKIVHYVK